MCEILRKWTKKSNEHRSRNLILELNHNQSIFNDLKVKYCRYQINLDTYLVCKITSKSKDLKCHTPA